MKVSRNRLIVGLGGVAALLLLLWGGMALLSPPQAAPLPGAGGEIETPAPSSGQVTSTPLPSPTEPTGPQPRFGGTVVELVPRAPDTFNPILTTNATTLAIAAKILPLLLAQDPHSGALTPGQMADAWTTSPDGRTLTFTLRQDAFWNDGRPVTAQDFIFTYRAIASPTVQSPYRELIAQVADVSAADDYTVLVTLVQPDCDILSSLTLPWLPSHLFAPDFTDLRTHPFNSAPSVGAGPLLFNGADADGSVRLGRNPDYWGAAQEGGIWLDGWIYRAVAEPSQRLALLASGQADVALLPANRVIAEPPGPGLTAYRFSDDGYSFVAVNAADPGEPVPGLDPTGAAVPQPPHPILGDRVVRQALAHAVDNERLIAEIYAGYGARMTSAILPTVAWAYAADLPPIDYDPGRAAALLDSAGWTLNGAAIRQKEGELMRLTLLVNDDDSERLALAAALAEMWRAVGVDVSIEAASFAEVVTALLDQTYDLAVAGWSDLGSQPMSEDFWRRAADQPGSGFNFTSYANPQVEELLSAARGLPGCDPGQRAQIYSRIQAQIQADVPYIFLSALQSTLVYTDRWQGIDPGPWGYSTNLAQWFLAE